MNPPETELEKIFVERRVKLSASIYAILFVTVTTYGFDRAFGLYLDDLVRAKQISRWNFLVNYVDTATATVFLAALIVVILCYRLGPLRITLRDMGLAFSVPRLKELVWGFLAGLLLYVASLPMLRLDQHNGLTNLIVDKFYRPEIVLVIALFAILLPTCSEVVYRGLIFKALLDSSKVIPAVLISAFAFALVWPVYNPIVGLLLGLTTALLFHRFRRVLPAIVANSVLTIALAMTLIYRKLY